MFRSRLRRPSPALVVAGVALIAALGGVAVASPVGSDGRVHLCYDQTAVDTQDGNMVVAVNDDATCPAEFPERLVINQRGPKGAPGAAGPIGQKGPSGAIVKVDAIESAIAEKLKKDLEKLDKKSDKQADLLEKQKQKMLELQKKRGQVKGDLLAKKQREFAERMNAMMELLKRLKQSQQQVVEQLTRP